MNDNVEDPWGREGVGDPAQLGGMGEHCKPQEPQGPTGY